MPTSELTLLSEHLRLARQAGFRFGEAWPVAFEAQLRRLSAGDRDDWLCALLDTRTAWERAYERRGRPLALSGD
jgi:hypothetical protein